MPTQRTTTPLLSEIGFCEGVRWHDGEVWFSDFSNRVVVSLEPGGAPRRRAYVAGQPSGLGFRPDGTPLVVSMYDRYLLAIDGDGLEPVADLGPVSNGPCNDMLVDPQGRAYISSIGFPLFRGTRDYQPSPLIAVGTDGTTSQATPPLELPNGMALSPDGKTLVVAESRGNRLTAFDVAPDGSLSGKRTFADLGELGPDGICMDAEGAVWAGIIRGGRFVRVEPDGTITDVVETDGRLAVTPVLGGDDGRTLFCSVAQLHATEPGSERAGAIETVHVDVPGF